MGGVNYVNFSGHIIASASAYYTDPGIADGTNRTIAFFDCDPWYNCTEYISSWQYNNGSIYMHLVGDNSRWNTTNDNYSYMVTMTYINATVASDKVRRGTFTRMEHIPATSGGGLICNDTDLTNGTVAQCNWTNRVVGNNYSWYVNITDGTNETWTDILEFTVLNTTQNTTPLIWGDYPSNQSILPWNTTVVELTTIINDTDAMTHDFFRGDGYLLCTNTTPEEVMSHSISIIYYCSQFYNCCIPR
jgi:hypothetical protein